MTLLVHWPLIGRFIIPIRSQLLWSLPLTADAEYFRKRLLFPIPPLS
jgi:hypothetical protein